MGENKIKLDESEEEEEKGKMEEKADKIPPLFSLHESQRPPPAVDTRLIGKGKRRRFRSLRKENKSFLPVVNSHFQLVTANNRKTVTPSSL